MNVLDAEEERKIMEKRKLNRRDFLRLSTAAGMGALVAACAPTAPQVVEVEKPVVVEKEVVKEVPVEKIIQQTVVVEKEVAKPAAPAKPVVLRELVWGGTARQVPLYELFAESFKERQPHITIEYEFTPSQQFRPKLKTQEAAGDPPDVVMPIGGAINTFRGPDFSIWLDLKPFVDRDDYDLTDFHQSGLESVKNIFTDALEGIPVQLFPGYIAYNKTIFQEKGMAEPTHDWEDTSWTVEALRDLAMKLTFDKAGNQPGDTGFDPDDIAIWGLNTQYIGEYNAFGYAFGRAVRTDGDARDFGGDEEGTILGAQFFQDLIYKDQVMPSPTERDELGAVMDSFMTGRVAIETSMAWELVRYASIEDFEWDVCPDVFGPVNRRTRLCIDQGCLTQKSKNHDAAWEWLKFITGPGMSERFSVDLRAALPPRASGLDLYMQRAAEAYPGIDATITFDALPRSRYMEYWRPPTEWRDLWSPYTDKVLANEATAQEAFPEGAEKVQENWDEYWAQFD
jgi:multiple sugar transport system substrate-binding protein